MYVIPNSSAEAATIIISDTSRYTLFSIYTETPEQYLFGSFIYGIGYSYAFKYFLITASLNHTINFKNLNKGFYIISNLINSSNSKGEYILSGDYVSFTLNFQFLKSKSKKKFSQNKNIN
jgi:hypothetical protein